MIIGSIFLVNLARGAKHPVLKRNFCGDGDTVRSSLLVGFNEPCAFHKKLFLQCLSATNLHGFHPL